MSLKSKGSNAERQLLHMFWKEGWACIRSAGSGSMNHPGPDLLAGSKESNRRVAIECKTSKSEKIYLSEYDINQLREFSEIFDARAWFAVRFDRKDWLFLSIEDIDKTKTGYVVDIKRTELKGISFQELISYEIRK